MKKETCKQGRNTASQMADPTSLEETSADGSTNEQAIVDPAGPEAGEVREKVVEKVFEAVLD
jgi:hypothetical protein